MIETTVNIERNLTIHKCSGNLTEKELIDTINSFYDGSPTLHTLWIFPAGSFTNISTEFVRKMFRLIKERGSVRQGGKSAIVSPEDLEYGFARMFQILSDTNDFPFQLQVFKTLDEAEHWIFSEE